VLGISPTNITGEGPSFLLSLYEQGKISEPMVSFSLGYKSPEKDYIDPSFAIFGGIDRNEYIGTINKYYLVSKYFWAPRVALISYADEVIIKYESTEY